MICITISVIHIINQVSKQFFCKKLYIVLLQTSKGVLPVIFWLRVYYVKPTVQVFDKVILKKGQGLGANIFGLVSNKIEFYR